MFILRWGEMSVVLQRRAILNWVTYRGSRLYTQCAPRLVPTCSLLPLLRVLCSWNLVNVSHTWRTDMKQLPQMLFHFLIHAFSFKVPSVCPPSQPLLFSYLLLNWSPSHSFTHILTWFERHWFLFSPEHSSTSAGSHLAAPPLSL